MPIYFVPTEEEYLARRVDKGKSWYEVYGSKSCTVCHKPFAPRDIYTTAPTGGFRHVSCGVA
jgi:hypothetical protein